MAGATLARSAGGMPEDRGTRRGGTVGDSLPLRSNSVPNVNGLPCKAESLAQNGKRVPRLHPLWPANA